MEAVDEDSEDSPDDTDPEADPAPQPSAIARSKQKAALTDDDGMGDVGGDDSDTDQGAPARDEAAENSAEDEIEVEGITAEDVIGYVGRDPYDTTVPRKQQSTLRRSLSKDTRVTWSGKVSAQGPPLPAAAISYLESELRESDSTCNGSDPTKRMTRPLTLVHLCRFYRQRREGPPKTFSLRFVSRSCMCVVR